jgi:hypothetical protein
MAQTAARQGTAFTISFALRAREADPELPADMVEMI